MGQVEPRQTGHAGSNSPRLPTVAGEGASRMTTRADVAAPSLTARSQHFEAALMHMKQGLCMFDRHSRLVVWNRRYCEIFEVPFDLLYFGMTQESLCGILIDRGCYIPGINYDDIDASTRQALRAENAEPILRKLSDGRMISILYRSIESGGWVATFEDVTVQRRAEERIAYLARHDSLTGLINARTLREDAPRLLAGIGAGEPMLVVLYIDLDRFKVINELHGHGQGDELLLAVAERLRRNSRPGDVISRLGSDEFAVIVRVADETAALAAARTLSDVLAAPYDLSRLRLRITASIGIAIDTAGESDVETLLREADMGARQAKVNDRGAIRLFDTSMSDVARLRHQLELEIHAAIVGEQFELHYQPLIEVTDGRIIGVEALVRWQHPTHGLLPPQDFIGIAEELGLIIPLGEWVLRRACADAVGWPAHIGVAVNVASAQMRQPTFAKSVLAIIAESGIDPCRLEIEMTEGALFVDTEATLGNLQAMSAAGIRIALDDFGTGYSSLSYLGRFPIGKIKIDRSFMATADSRADSRAIIRAIAGIGIGLGMTTLIEGVETSAHLDIARAEGISQAQGYFFSSPLAKADLQRFFDRSA